MNEIDSVSLDRLLQPSSHLDMYRSAHGNVDVSRWRADGAQLAADDRAFRRDHDRAMPGLDERAIDARQHLLGAAHRIGRDRRERIGDADDRQLAHACAIVPSHGFFVAPAPREPHARDATVRQRSLDACQPKPS